MATWLPDPRLVDAICRQLGTRVDREVVDGVVAELNLYPKFQHTLLEYMDNDPEALVSGRSDGPASRLQLLDALAVIYPGVVVRASCASCGRQVHLNRWGADGSRVCGTCYVNNRLVVCARCGRERPVGGRHSIHGLVCPACIRWDPERRHECSRCGHVLPVAARDPKGEALCQTCRPREAFVCAGCGRTHKVKSLIVENGNLCWACYKRQHKQACHACGRKHSQVPRRGPNGERLCDRCWHPDLVPCRDCGTPTSPKTRRVRGSHLCYPCYEASRPQRPCAVCATTSPIRAELPLGPVCKTCYQQIRCKPQPCARCAEVRPLVGTAADDGQRICAGCCGQPRPWTCGGCGALAAPYSRGRCVRCTAREDLIEAVSRDGEVLESLLPLLDYFDIDSRPMSAVTWTRSASAGILRRLIREDGLSHEALDNEEQRGAAAFLRAVLVFTKVLPDRDFELDDTVVWMVDRLRTVQPRHEVIVRRYALWHVLARARRRPVRPGTRHHVRDRIGLALRLIRWLEDRGGQLEDLSQSDLDRWLAVGSPARAQVRDFIGWARRQGVIGNLRMPSRTRTRPSGFLSSEQRWASLHRCIADSRLPLNLRSSGALLLLFGLGPTRLATTHVEQVVERQDVVELIVGRTPIRLPEPIAGLVIEQKRAAQLARTDWLFPGQHPGRHINPDTLAVRLGSVLGCSVRPSRNAALAHLAKELPVPVLADYLGLAYTTAAQWADLVERQWSDYIVARRRGVMVGAEPGNRAGTE